MINFTTFRKMWFLQYFEKYCKNHIFRKVVKLIGFHNIFVKHGQQFIKIIKFSFIIFIFCKLVIQLWLWQRRLGQPVQPSFDPPQSS